MIKNSYKKIIMYDYIKKCGSVSVAKICKDLNIDNTTISKGTASEEKFEKVFKYLLKNEINNIIEVLENETSLL